MNIEASISTPVFIDANFALICSDNGMMNARLLKGDIVYIRQQDTVENGDITAVLLPCSEMALLRKFYRQEDCIVLEAANPMFRSLVLYGEDMKNIRILGKAVGASFEIKNIQPINQDNCGADTAVT